MKREQIIAFGVPEERIREFQAAYWADLHKCAQRMTAENTDQQTADESRSLLEAITAMVKQGFLPISSASPRFTALSTPNSINL